MDLTKRRDFIAPLTLNYTTHLYEQADPFIIGPVISGSAEIFDETPTYIVLKEVPEADTSYSTCFVYRVTVNGTSHLVHSFTQGWF